MPIPTTIFTIKLFAAARDLISAQYIEIMLPTPVTIAEIQKMLIQKHPILENIVRQSRWAINNQYALDSDEIPHGATVALIPPVSGG
jgi:molybdopterin converting factor small subunit